MSRLNENPTGLKQTVVIAGVEITTDAAGRFNLNALHRASATDAHKQPSQWLRRDETTALVMELEKSQSVDLQFGAVSTVRGGNSPGTFVHELLAVEYAGWISPAFRLAVNQVFIDFRTGKSQQPAMPMTYAAALRELADVAEKNERLQVDSDALHRLAHSEGDVIPRIAAKSLQLKPKELTDWLCLNGWTYRGGNGRWAASQLRIDQGHLRHKVTTFNISGGKQRSEQQVMITPRGLALIAKRMEVSHVSG